MQIVDRCTAVTRKMLRMLQLSKREISLVVPLVISAGLVSGVAGGSLRSNGNANVELASPGAPQSEESLSSVGASVTGELDSAKLNYAITELTEGLSKVAKDDQVVPRASVAGVDAKTLSSCSAEQDATSKIACLTEVVRDLSAATEPSASAAPEFIPPMYGLITSGYGVRHSPFGDAEDAFHDGIDIAAPKDAVFVAPADGLVIAIEKRTGYGSLVTVQHQNGYETRFAHVGGLFVKEGQLVRRGQPMGVVGLTGKITGPHLHYEMLHNGELMNPKPFVDLPTVEEIHPTVASATKVKSKHKSL